MTEDVKFLAYCLIACVAVAVTAAVTGSMSYAQGLRDGRWKPFTKDSDISK